MDTESDFMPDESEQLDQMQPEETLLDRGVADVLDEGYTAPEHWSAAEGFGNTASEMHQGESLDQKLAAEVPDVIDTGDSDRDWRDDPDDPKEEREVGNRRAGRLVGANHGYDGEDVESDTIGEDVGIDGAAACAEEAAMHIIDPSDDDVD